MLQLNQKLLLLENIWSQYPKWQLLCILRQEGHLENKVDVYDQRNDCNLNLDPEMTIVAHDILVHNIWLNFLKILNIWKLIPLTCKALREIF